MKDGRDSVAALKAIATSQAPFISRGDKSGTNAAELRLWKSAGQTPEVLGKEKWYRDIGGGMGQALNAARAMDAYTLTDRGTWLSFNNKGSLGIGVVTCSTSERGSWSSGQSSRQRANRWQREMWLI